MWEFAAAFAVLVFGCLLFWLVDPGERRWRAFERQMRARKPTNNEELAARYFADEGIAAEIPRGVRQIFAEQMGYDAVKMLPDDELGFYWNELDAVDLICEIENQFGVYFSDVDLEGASCTIRDVVRIVARKLKSRNDSTPAGL